MPTPLRALVVEDSDDDTTLLVRTLRQGGYDVVFERVDSAEAMETALEAGPWDLIVADFSMPGFGAPAALRMVRERGIDLPFIIVSGTISRDLAVRMMHEGAQDFLAKDDVSRLLPAIARELRAAEERRARRAAEETLRSSEESFRLLFAANPQPMWVYDLQSLAILEVNDAAIALYGYRRDEFLRMRVSDLALPDTAPWLTGFLQRPGADPVPALTWQHRLKDGRNIDVEIAARTLTFAGLEAGLVVTTDITARNRALQALERAKEAAEDLAHLRSDFVAAVSHELRTPLTAITGYAEVLRERWPHMAEEKRLDLVARMVSAANRQRRLVEDLLLLSRLETKDMTLEREIIALTLLVREAADETRANYKNQSIELTGPEDLHVLADPVRAVQVLANLMDNAAKYSPEGASVAVSWRREGTMAAVRVRDGGPGISDEGRAYLFRRFGRVPGSRMRAGRVGTGLGLYLGRQIAEAMGGDLDLEATGREGSIFRLRLPLVPRQVPGTPP